VPTGGLIMSAPDGSFGSAARALASSGVRDSAGAGLAAGRVDSFAPGGAGTGSFFCGCGAGGATGGGSGGTTAGGSSGARGNGSGVAAAVSEKSEISGVIVRALATLKTKAPAIAIPSAIDRRITLAIMKSLP